MIHVYFLLINSYKNSVLVIDKRALFIRSILSNKPYVYKKEYSVWYE